MANFDDLIDKIAFGKTAPKPGPVLGLYLSPEVIYIAETHLEKGKIVVSHLVRIPVPAPEKGVSGPAATGTLNTDFLVNNAKLSVLIRQSMSTISWSTKDCFVTLSHHLGLLRYFAMPAVDKRFWGASVPLEAKKYIPIPFDALSHDFQVAPLPPDATNKPRQAALISVTQRKNLQNITALLSDLDLKLIGMEVAPCSVLRMWEALDQPRQGKTHCQVHFDGGNIRILLADRGLPVFFRELFLGKETSLSDLRKIDLGGCAGFAQKQLGAGQVNQVYVSGSVPNLAEWQEAFAKETGQQVEVHDTPTRLGIKGGDWGGYAAIGASLRLLSQSPMTLDLGQIGRVSDEERRTARDLMLVSTLLAVFFSAVGLYRNATYSYRARELSKYQSAPDVEAAFTGKGPPEIDTMLREMNSQSQSALIVLREPTKPTVILQDLVNALPDNTWLVDMNLKNPINRTMGGDPEMNFQGRAKAASIAFEQDLAFEYREKLLKTGLLGKLFPDIQISVQGRPVAMDQTQSLTPEMLQNLLEERTTFRATAKKLKP
jgi:hypothetical protein